MTRLQSGSPIRLTSGRTTLNQNDSGVILHNITASQLQDMMSIRKVTLAATANSGPLGAVYYLPQSLIDNTNAAFEVNGKTLANLDKNAPYIGPADQPGQMGQRVFLYGPMQQKWDFSLGKKTIIGERANVEFRMQALNAFNLTNFLSVRARQRHHDDAGCQRDGLRTDVGRLPRSFEHERSGRPHRGVQPPV